MLVDERTLWPPDAKFVTANIVVRTHYLQQKPEVIKKLLAAHVDETSWINNHTYTEFKKLMGKTLAENECNKLGQEYNSRMIR
jgi:NitT/TauT family transport system substrate-binding protein